MKAIIFTLFIILTQAGSAFTSIQPDSLTIINLHLSAKDTLKIQSIENNQRINKPWFNDTNMPWIVSLLISILTVGINLWIGRVNSKTAIRNVKTQIENSSENSQNQITTSKELALKQISNSHDLAVKQFNGTLLSKNRQDWVIEVRHVLSELSTQAYLYNIEIQNEQGSKEKLRTLQEKVWYFNTKLILLLKKDSPKHEEVLRAMNSLLTALELHLLNSQMDFSNMKEVKYDNQKLLTLNNNLVTSGQELLYDEWRKIQAFSVSTRPSASS